MKQYVFRSKHICGKTIGRAKDEGKIQGISCLWRRVRGYDKKELTGGFKGPGNILFLSMIVGT